MTNRHHSVMISSGTTPTADLDFIWASSSQSCLSATIGSESKARWAVGGAWLVCSGRPIAVQDIGPGHRLIQYFPASSGDMAPYIACALCHRTGRSKRSFSGRCDERPTKSTTCAFRRLERGLHPHSRGGAAICFKAGIYMDAT